jgi:hypothetical protein
MSVATKSQRSRQIETGVIAGIVLCSVILVWLAFTLGFPPPEPSPLARDRMNLRQLALGMIHYAEDHKGQLPPQAAIVDKGGKPLLSWRVAILPYIEEDTLYKKFHLDEPWDSPHNKALLLEPIPELYAHPKDPEAAEQGLTPYRLFVGPLTAFEGPNPRYPDSIPRGTPNTIMIVEAADAVPWTKPDELRYHPDGPLPRLGGRFPGGFNAVMWDRTVRFLDTKEFGETKLREAITACEDQPLGGW